MGVHQGRKGDELLADLAPLWADIGLRLTVSTHRIVSIAKLPIARSILCLRLLVSQPVWEYAWLLVRVVVATEHITLESDFAVDGPPAQRGWHLVLWLLTVVLRYCHAFSALTPQYAHKP